MHPFIVNKEKSQEFCLEDLFVLKKAKLKFIKLKKKKFELKSQ